MRAGSGTGDRTRQKGQTYAPPDRSYKFRNKLHKAIRGRKKVRHVTLISPMIRKIIDNTLIFRFSFYTERL